jgi:VCBS repeat-containing protein
VAGTYGTLHLNTNGSYTYTLDNSNPAVQALAEGQTVSDVFSYTNSDVNGASSTTSLTVTVTGTNDAPVAVADVAAVKEDTNTLGQPNPATGNVLGNDTDVDAGDTHTVTAVNGSGAGVNADVAGTYGTLHLNTNGSYTYTLDNTNPAVQALAEGQTVSDVFSYTNSDVNGASSTTSLTVTVTGTNDAPVAVADVAAVKEDTNTLGQPNPATGNVLTNDGDVDTGDTHTVTAVNGSGAGVNADVAGTYGTLHLNANGSYTYTLDNSKPAVQALAEGQTVADAFGYTESDNHGATSTASLTVTITGTNDAPVVDNVAASATYPPGSLTPVVLSSGLTISDVDNTTLSGATVTISSATTFLGDLLDVNLATSGGHFVGTNISATYNPANATLTLTGTDTLQNYEQVLEHVTFSSNNPSPTNGGLGATRTIEWQVNDGSATNNLSAISAATETVIHLHTLDLDSSATGFDSATTYTEHGSPPGTALPVVNGNVTITDPDSSDMISAVVTLTNAHSGDQLTLGTLPSTIQGTIDTSQSGEIIVTLTPVNGISASTDDYRAALQQVLYSSTSSDIDITPRNLTVVVTDSLHVDTNAANVTISIVAVNDAPTLDAHGGSLGYTENNTATAIDPLLTLSDPDSANIQSATVQITGNFHAGEDVLGFTDQNGITGHYDSTTGVMTLTGASTVANYEAALRSVTYFNSSDDPSAQTRTISFEAVDDGGAASSVSTATVSVAPVNDAPVMTGHTASVGFTENGVPVVLSSGVVVADADSTLLTGATVAITGGFVAGDTLTAGVTKAGITVSYDSATGVLTLSGQDTKSNYQDVLASITFASTSDNPTSFGTQPTRTVTWSLTDLDQTSTAHANATGTAATNIDVTAINDAPVVSARPALNFDANTGQPIAIDAGILVHDVDSLTLASAKIAITAGFDAANDRLNFVDQHGITGSYDAATGVLTLSGVASVADYQAALASVTFGSIAQQNGARTIAWSVDDGSALSHQSLTDTTTLNVKGLILPPHTFTDNGATSSSTPNITPASFVGNSDRSFELAPPTSGDHAGISGSGTGFHVVHSDAVLTTASDATVHINLALAALEAPFGGDLVLLTARQANGDPLPAWLTFDPATGTFAGLPPDGAVASIEDANGVTGSVPPNSDLGIAGLNTPAQPTTITIEVTARDSKGNIAVTVFTIELRPRTIGRHGWNIDRNAPPSGHERHASVPMLSPELAAIEAAVRDVTRSLEPFAMRDMPARHGERIAAEAVPAGRAGLTEQLASIGWRSMAAQRNALLASLQQGR